MISLLNPNQRGLFGDMNPALRFLVAATVALALAGEAAGSCDDRPGTPNELRADPNSSSSILLSWRNTTGKGYSTSHSSWFDISVRDEFGKPVNQDLTGCCHVTTIYGQRSSHSFTGLGANKSYTFQIRARTAANSGGCTSAIFSAPVQAKTLAFDGPPPPAAEKKPAKILGKRVPNISITPEPNNVFLIYGRGFLNSKPVTIRVADDALKNAFITHAAGRRIESGELGTVTVRLSGLCSQPGNLYFSANDGRMNSADRTGTDWSNTVQVTCR